MIRPRRRVGNAISRNQLVLTPHALQPLATRGKCLGEGARARTASHHPQLGGVEFAVNCQGAPERTLHSGLALMTLQATDWIWFNGRMVPWREATVHVMTYALHMGAAAFEGIRCYDTANGPHLFSVDAHMRRLIASAAVYRMMSPFSSSELAGACSRVVHENGLRSAYLRPLIWRGCGGLGTDPTDVPVEAMVAAVRLDTYHGSDALKNGIDVGISSWTRVAGNTLPAGAKVAGNYLSAQLVALEARRHGYAEGIALDQAGNVSEGSAENLFMVRDGVLFTPPVTASILPGITRDVVATLAQQADHEVREQAIPGEALYSADEVFLTGTAAEITPVRSIDRYPVGNAIPGPITQQLQRTFVAICSGLVADSWGWLTPVGITGAAPTTASAPKAEPG